MHSKVKEMLCAVFLLFRHDNKTDQKIRQKELCKTNNCKRLSIPRSEQLLNAISPRQQIIDISLRVSSKSHR